MSAGPKRPRDEDLFRSACTGMRGPDHPEEREARARRRGYDAGRADTAAAEHRAAAAALRAAAGHFRARSEREGSADFWQAAQWCDGEAAKREEESK